MTFPDVTETVNRQDLTSALSFGWSLNEIVSDSLNLADAGIDDIFMHFA